MTNRERREWTCSCLWPYWRSQFAISSTFIRSKPAANPLQTASRRCYQRVYTAFSGRLERRNCSERPAGYEFLRSEASFLTWSTMRGLASEKPIARLAFLAHSDGRSRRARVRFHTGFRISRNLEITNEFLRRLRRQHHCPGLLISENHSII